MAAELRITVEQRTFINYMLIKFSHVKVTQRVQMIQQMVNLSNVRWVIWGEQEFSEFQICTYLLFQLLRVGLSMSVFSFYNIKE